MYFSLSLALFISLNAIHLHIEKVKVSSFTFENIAAQVHFLNLMEVIHEVHGFGLKLNKVNVKFCLQSTLFL